MEEINNSKKDQLENDNISPNIIKRTTTTTTIIKNSKPIMITPTPTPPSINKLAGNDSNENSPITNIGNKTDNDNDKNEIRNEFFVVSDIVQIENSTPPPPPNQQSNPTLSNSINRLNAQQNNNNSNYITTTTTTNNNSPGQLIDIPLSPFKDTTNTTNSNTTNTNPINPINPNKLNKKTKRKGSTITINQVDELPSGSELKEHKIVTRDGIIETPINNSDSSSSPSSSSLNQSKPFIPPPSTQLFPKVELNQTKKELKKEKKIEKDILEAIQEHHQKEINNHNNINEIDSPPIFDESSSLPQSHQQQQSNLTQSQSINTSNQSIQTLGGNRRSLTTEELLIQKNLKKQLANKKKKKKIKKKKYYLEHKKNSLGETIYKGHPSWLLMRTIQTGILNCISKTTSSHQSIKEDSDEFFQSLHYVLPVIEEHPNNMTFNFKDYCPHAFSRLRELFNIDSISYVHSICKPWNEVVTPGKSGSIFYFSNDNQYVLKTIPKREAKLLRSLLPEYYEHMKRNPNSLLTKFFGLHRVKPQKGRQVRFLVMKNLFCTPKEITQRFDLKGSTVGRELSAEELKKTCPTFKDLDFRRLGKKIHLGPDRKKLFMHQLSEDCKFLVKLNIMDYSLLIGLHNKEDYLKKLNEQQYYNGGNGDDNFSTGDEDELNGDDYSDTEDNNITGSNMDLMNNNGSNNDLRVSKKISSIKETKNYLNYFDNNNLNNQNNNFGNLTNINNKNNNNMTTTTNTVNQHIHHQNHQHHHQQPLSHSQSSYMKPVDQQQQPILPPILSENQPSPQTYIKPKISIFEHDKGGMQGIDDKNQALGEYYFVGIIDILSFYSFRKQVEHTYKSIFSKGEISSVDPVEYAARFINFIADTIV